MDAPIVEVEWLEAYDAAVSLSGVIAQLHDGEGVMSDQEVKDIETALSYIRQQYGRES